MTRNNNNFIVIKAIRLLLLESCNEQFTALKPTLKPSFAIDYVQFRRLTTTKRESYDNHYCFH